MKFFEFFDKENPYAKRKLDGLKVVTLTRTQGSRYSFMLLKAAMHKLIRGSMETLINEKSPGFASTVKARIEEYDIFNSGVPRLIALEGFPQRWISQLKPTANTYILAETDDGMYDPIDSTNWSDRGNLVKVLVELLDLRQLDPPLTARDLVNLSWPRAPEEIEALLRLAAASGWTAERLKEELDENLDIKLLYDMKAGHYELIYESIKRTSSTSVMARILWQITDLAKFKIAQEMFSSPESIAKAVGLHGTKGKKWQALVLASESINYEDLLKLTSRAIDLEKMILMNNEMATDLFILNSGIAVR